MAWMRDTLGYRAMKPFPNNVISSNPIHVYSGPSLGSVLRDIIRMRQHLRDDGNRLPARRPLGVAAGGRGCGVPSPLLCVHSWLVDIRKRVLAHLGHHDIDVARYG